MNTIKNFMFTFSLTTRLFFLLFSDRDALRSNFVTRIYEYFKRQLFKWTVKDVDEINRCVRKYHKLQVRVNEN